MTNVVPIDRFRTGKAYTITQAARLAETSPQNVSRWLRGYSYADHHMAPLFGEVRAVREENAPPRLSFLQLSELVIASRIRNSKSRISLDKIREAHEFARTRWGIEYPFASLKLSLLGGEIIHEFETQKDGARSAIAISSGGTWVLPPMVEQAIALFEYDEEDGLAVRWFPAGRDSRLVVDPRVAAGRPVIQGTLVTIDGIKARFKAGQDMAFIAHELSISRRDVENAVRFAEAA